MTLDQIIESLHGRIGRKILESWEFPEDLVLVPGHYTDFDRNVADVDFVDLVMVSYLQTRHVGNQVARPDRPAQFVRLVHRMCSIESFETGWILT